MEFSLHAIGTVHTDTPDVEIPRHWSASAVSGVIDIDPKFSMALAEISPGDKIVVLFVFHRSPEFSDALLRQTPPHATQSKGVFSICSPVRPNPIGMSVVKVVAISGSSIVVEGIDMFDGTPVLDIKPHIERQPDGSRQ
jgi:tRNA-Thr(GGU) m(6)t(6)A37 methyltransferase TsaA